MSSSHFFKKGITDSVNLYLLGSLIRRLSFRINFQSHGHF